MNNINLLFQIRIKIIYIKTYLITCSWLTGYNVIGKQKKIKNKKCISLCHYDTYSSVITN